MFENIKKIKHYHYTVSPFNYKICRAKNFKLKSNIKIYDGVVQLIDEIKNEKNF